jgi:hypothetical protein
VPGRGALKRRLRTLSAREEEGQRDLGVLVFEMFRTQISPQLPQRAEGKAESLTRWDCSISGEADRR